MSKRRRDSRRCRAREVATHLSFVVSHGAPLSGSKNTLLCRFSFITENLLDQLWIRANALEKHEVCAKWLLRRIRVLHVGFSGFTGLALSGPVNVLPLNVIGSEGAHVRRKLPFPSVFGSLRHTLVFLGTKGRRGQISGKRRLDKEPTSFSAALRFAYS